MAPRLDPRAENAEHRGLRSREQPGGDRRHRRRAHFGDEPAVHRDQRLARFGPEEQDHRVVARDALVVGVKRDQLGAERAAVSRHEPQEALVLGDRQHHAHGLNDLATRQVGHRLRHGGDQILHLQEIVHRGAW